MGGIQLQISECLLLPKSRGGEEEEPSEGALWDLRILGAEVWAGEELGTQPEILQMTRACSSYGLGPWSRAEGGNTPMVRVQSGVDGTWWD